MIKKLKLLIIFSGLFKMFVWIVKYYYTKIFILVKFIHLNSFSLYLEVRTIMHLLNILIIQTIVLVIYDLH